MSKFSRTRSNFLKVAALFIVLPLLMGFASDRRPAAEAKQIDLSAIKSPIILKGDATTAYRDPTCIYHNGLFRLFYTYIITKDDGKHYWAVAFSKSSDLIHWTEPKIITPVERNLNFASPGNIIRFGDDWILCLQTYPTPNGQKYGNEDCRVWIIRSRDLENWGTAELLRVKGPDVPFEKMGRLIDAYLIEDKDEPGKWWCFFDDNAANMSCSCDLKTWTYFNRIEAGENVCILVDGDEYLMFHSPRNGIGMKRSKDLKTWRDVGAPTGKHGTGSITLGQKDWPWAQGRLSAGFVLDLRKEPAVGKYLMFFHGSGPEDERTMFSTFCSLGLAWSDDLVDWDWPGKDPRQDNVAPVNAPFDMPRLTRPTFPDRTIDIRGYGAVGDGQALNTKAFAAAIADCAQTGGGRVVVPPGTWLSGPIHLKSNINLHLEKGAEIRFSTNFDDYLPVVLTRYEGIECYNYSPPIYANNCTNIALTGAGKLDGQGRAWWTRKAEQKRSAKKLHEMTRGTPVKDRIFGSPDAFLRPSFIQFINCRDVLLEGVTVSSGPMWTIHPVYCENVIVRKVTLHTKGPNNDGVNPDSCKNVLIEYCNFDTSDDAVAIKSGRDEDGWRVGRPSENIVVRHCRFGLGEDCDGVVSIGSEMSGDVRNVLVRNCHFDRTVRGIRIKSMRGRAGVVENIWMQDITTGHIGGEPVLLNTFYGSSSMRPFSDKPPLFRNINIRNVDCRRSRNALTIRGLPEQPIENVTIENLSVAAENGLTCSDAKGIELANVNIRPDKGPVMLIKDSRDVAIRNSTCAKGTDIFLRLEGENTKNVRLIDNDLLNARRDVLLGEGVAPDAVVNWVRRVSQSDKIDFAAIKSPIVLKGDEDRAFRDPAACYHRGVFRLYYTYWLKDDDDSKRYSYTAVSKSTDLINWTEPRIITPKDLNLNFSSPGNVIRFGNDWILCLQTYPTPEGQKYGNDDCRLWIMRSKDLENWGPAEMLMVKGPNVPVEKMGRLIDAYLVEDKDRPGKWWCFFDDNAANMSYSYDLKTWTYFNRIPCGENPCVLIDNDEYLLIYDPKDEGRGAGMKRSSDLVHWKDIDRRIPLRQNQWPWAPDGIQAAFVIDLRHDPCVGKYLMFFHAGPGFKEYVSVGLAWSEDLIHWCWPRKNTKSP
ncbi:MAG: glycosyl hydrolase family 28 protein [Planctomycetota bacterium]|jgi:polygalacturonase